MLRSCRLGDLSWKELSEEDTSKVVAIIPIGSVEQHGPHLSLIGDTTVAETVASGIEERLGGKVPFLILPTLPYGQSPEHLDFAGTISLRTETLLAVLRDIVSSLAVHGFKKILFINGHGGNSDLLRAASFQFRRDYDVHVFVLSAWDLLPGGKLPFVRQSDPTTDLHGGELETSLFMAIEPDRVQMQMAGAELPEKYRKSRYVTLCGPIYYGWSSLELSSTGAEGQPEYASREKGELIIDMLIRLACEGVQEIAEIW